MASRNATVADTVKTLLNAAAAGDAENPEVNPFGVNFIAERVAAPVEDLDAITALEVKVWTPGDSGSDTEAKKLRQYEIPVVVAMAIPLPSGCDPSSENGNAQIDGFTEMVERVADYITAESFGSGGINLGAGGQAFWTKTATAFPNSDTLLNDRLFFALITYTFTLLKRI
jgi:hypothetical protein